MNCDFLMLINLMATKPVPSSVLVILYMLRALSSISLTTQRRFGDVGDTLSQVELPSISFGTGLDWAYSLPFSSYLMCPLS